MKLLITEIVIDPTIQIRRSNHEQTIQRYEASFDKLPPVDVFDTSDGKLLADGFHRTAAAERLGRSEIEANVRTGTRADALEWAVIANTKNADPLAPEERDAGIRRLRQLHPDWSLRKIADAMSVSPQTATRVFQIDDVKRATVTGVPAGTLTDTHYREIAPAPQEAWQPLVEAAQERGWTHRETAAAVQALRDDRVPQEHKDALLKGEADPVTVNENGQLGVPIDRVNRVMRDLENTDGYFAFQKVLGALANVRQVFEPEQIIEGMDSERRARFVRELRTIYIPYFEELANAAETRRLEAVR